MKPTVTFTRSDGQVYAIDDKLLGIVEIEGLGKSATEIFTEKRAVGNGDVVTGKRVPSRAVTIKARSRVNGINRQLREIASSFFSSLYTYDVDFQYEGIEKSAKDCEIKVVDMPTENVNKPFRIAVTVLVPAGYLQGGGMNGQNLNGVRGGFGFPYVSLVDFGMVYGVYLYNKQTTVINDGVAPTYMRADITARGEVENPKLICNGSYIRLVAALEQGDRVEIDTEKRMVLLNGENAITMLDKKSSFHGMEMQVGSNVIGFDADSGDNLLDVSVYWAKKYETM